jgi:hypothetical protein
MDVSFCYHQNKILHKSFLIQVIFIKGLVKTKEGFDG